MNSILLSISAAAIVTAVFRIMTPEDKYGKQIKLIISCFFIVVVMNIFSDNINFFEISEILNSENVYSDFEDVFRKQTADEVANSLRTGLYQKFAEEGIEPEKIYIDVNISENDCISISKIKLVFGDANTCEAERAVSIADKFCGYEITVELEEQ